MNEKIAKEWYKISKWCHLDGPPAIEHIDDGCGRHQHKGALGQQPETCRDCKGTGVYVGLFSRETCKACGGTQKYFKK